MSKPAHRVGSVRGAPMGRPCTIQSGSMAALTVSRVQLREGYDAGGAYWGDGDTLFYFESGDGESECYRRGIDRAAAKASVLADFPNVTFIGEEDGNIEDFIAGYMDTALRLSMDEAGNPLSESGRYIADSTWWKMIPDCRSFVSDNRDLIAGYIASGRTFEQAGADLWMTATGAGAGFWSRDLPGDLGDKLSAAAEKYRGDNLYIGDDGLIY